MSRSVTAPEVGHGIGASSARRLVSGPAIGKLQTVVGLVTITRADVIVAKPTVGDLVYERDVIETGIDGVVAIVFADGTTFQLYADAHLVLDEFVCGAEKSANSALFRLVKGVFSFIAGKMATTGRLIIDTPVGQVRATATGAGIGSLAFGILTFSLLRELKAASTNVALLDDGTIAAKDLPHGVFTIHTKDGQDINVDDPGTTLIVQLRGSGASFQLVANSAEDMARHHNAYLSVQDIYSRGQLDPFILHWQRADANPQSTGSTGSSTSPTILGLNTINNIQPLQNTNANTSHNSNGSNNNTSNTGTVTDVIPPAPPPPPTVKPVAVVGIEGQPVKGELPPVPEPPPVSPTGQEGSPIQLFLGVTPSNGSNLASVVVSAIPPGAMLTDLTNTFLAMTSDSSVNVANWNLSSLFVTAPNDTDFTLSVTATDQSVTGLSAGATGTEMVTVNPQAPTVLGATAPAPPPSPPVVTGVENSKIALNLGVQVNSLPGDHPANTLASLVVSAIPPGAILTDGTKSFIATTNDTSIDVSQWNYNSLMITPPPGFVGSFTLTVTGTEQDTEGNFSVPTINMETVTVNSPGLVVQVTQLPTDYLQADILDGGLHGVSITLAGQVLFTYGGTTYSTAYVSGSGMVAEPPAVMNGATTEPFDVPPGLVIINAQGDLVYNENDFQFLSQGETIQYSVSFDVEQGAFVVEETLPLTIVGANEPPYVVSASPNPTPILAPTSATPDPIVGTIIFADPNWHDTHTVSFAYDSSSTIATLAGPTSLSLTQEQALQLGVFAVPSTPAQDSYTATLQPSQNVGMVDWTFTVDPAGVNALPFGTVVTEVYDVFITDEWGASAEQEVVIVVDGPPQWIGTVGNWDDVLDWSTGLPPRQTDPVDIPSPSAGRQPVEVILTDTHTIADLEIDAGATLNIADSGWLTVSGASSETVSLALSDSGMIELDSSGHLTTLAFGGTFTVQSDGAIEMLGAGPYNMIIAASIGAILDNYGTISGTGQIGNNNGGLTLNNESSGTIDANVVLQTLTIQTGNTITNAGLLEATGGGTLDIQDTTIANSGTGSLGIKVDGTSTFEVDVANLQLTGNGAVTLLAGSQVIGNAAGDTLENFNNTISGAGTIGHLGNGKLTLTNDAGGTIDANVPGQTLTIDTGNTDHQCRADGGDWQAARCRSTTT
jgi:hypothetical protein